jgi:hypothetical protein
MGEQLVLKQVVTARVINGLEMGVLEDGTAFLTGRSLARLCGVAYSTIIERKQEWEAGDRSGKFARFLASTGFSDAKLSQSVKSTGAGVAATPDAYPEQVVMAALEYYAFEHGRPEALANFRTVARAGFRLFVYGALGYAPSGEVPTKWREFHDRLSMHTLPAGYFSVFREMADFILLSIQNGFKMDHQTVPDISVGKRWAAHWKEQVLAAKHGERIHHQHNYPEYFPQAASNPQDMNVYPVAALGEFRLWLQNEYIPKHFPAYVVGKVKAGLLPASAAELLLAAVDPDEKN